MLAFTLLLGLLAVLGAATSKVDTGAEELSGLPISKQNPQAILYQPTHNEADFTKSRSDCTHFGQGAGLAEPRTPTEYKNLENYIIDLGSDAANYWLGGLCNVNLGQYVWLGETDKPIAATHFKSGVNSCSYDNQRVTAVIEMEQLKLAGGLKNTLRRAICQQDVTDP